MPLTAEALFERVFLPQYPEDAKRDLGRCRSIDANPAQNPSIRAHLTDAAERFVALAGEGLDLDYSDASVHRLSAALSPRIRDELLEKGELFPYVVHGAAYVGECIVRSHGAANAKWAMRNPLWESLVTLKSRAGEADLPVFHWWLKSFEDDAKATLVDRYRAHVEVPTAPVEELPVIAPPDRNLPKLAKVRYDALYKYLRAHLPELRDLGEHFPSPERFEELAFESLSFFLVGGGRMLVMAGRNEHGMHAFWLTKEGFEKSAFWPADDFPAPIFRPSKDAEKLEVILSHDGTPRSFELLWWGP